MGLYTDAAIGHKTGADAGRCSTPKELDGFKALAKIAKLAGCVIKITDNYAKIYKVRGYNPHHPLYVFNCDHCKAVSEKIVEEVFGANVPAPPFVDECSAEGITPEEDEALRRMFDKCRAAGARVFVRDKSVQVVIDDKTVDVIDFNCRRCLEYTRAAIEAFFAVN